MLMLAALFVTAFAYGFGYLTVDALRSGKVRRVGYIIGRADAPIGYWTGVCAYGLISLVASGFFMLVVGLMFVR